MAHSREIVLLARRRLPRLPPRLVDTPAVGEQVVAPTAPLPAPHKRSLRERQAAAAVALMQAAGGARRMLAGAVASVLAVIGVLLILFPLVMSVVLAAGALVTSLGFAGYALARRRRRRDSDVH